MNRFMVRSGDALQERGHEVHYLFREDLYPGVGRGSAWRRLSAPWLIPLAVRNRARKEERYDLVEIHEPLAGPYCFMRRRRAGSWPPCAALSFGTEERAWRAQRERWRRVGLRVPVKSRVSVPLTLLVFSRYALRHADQVLVPNDRDRDYVRSSLGVSPERISRVNSGVGEPFFSIERVGREGVRRFLFIGSWGDREGRDRKGVWELVEAWRRVVRRDGLSLALIGTLVSERTVREAFPPDLRDGISVRAEATGDQLRAELARADAFVLPSWMEGMPLSTLEAAAAGLPCVVSAIPGHVEIFRPSDPEADGGILIPPHDASALAGALERLIDDPQLARTVGRNARKRARAFTWEKTAEQLEAAYVRCVGGRP
jgi:glycosyltransferase involved in cell wall biosynthesis